MDKGAVLKLEIVGIGFRHDVDRIVKRILCDFSAALYRLRSAVYAVRVYV